MSVRVDNNAYELIITPNKRKRANDDKIRSNSTVNCCSSNKENHFVFNNFMEVKSIAEIFAQRKEISGLETENPYEVTRKPPKKKSKHELDNGCFENPALNLNVPEKILNPFEVKREPVVPVNNHCFVNSGLNLRSVDREVRNPFEVTRDHPPTPKEVHGIENPALDIKPTLSIGLPFTPTVGCRIDFSNLPLDALTPSSMLNKKLVFSPVNKTLENTPRRRELSIISEEAVDISKELDCYQLELENSMNEAKASKKRGNKNLMDIKRKSTFAVRLAEQQPEEEKFANNNDSITSEIFQHTEHSCDDNATGGSECPRSSTPKTPKEQCIAKFPVDKSIADNPDVVYEEVEESQTEIVIEKDEELFKNPAPFVRTYRRDIKKPMRNADHQDVDVVVEKEKDHEMFGNIRSSIRKSIRKIMNHGNKSKATEEADAQDRVSISPPNFLTSLRQSLRRKKTVVPESVHEMSIIDCKERPIFKDTTQGIKKDMDNKEDVGLFGTKTTTTIRHSFRRSSRRVMKTVLNKKVEDYSFEK